MRSPDDIWDEIVRATKLPGTTSAPKLQPIAARLVMLQSGMRSPLGLKVSGPSLEAIEAYALAAEPILRGVPGVRPEAGFPPHVRSVRRSARRRPGPRRSRRSD